MELAAVTQVQLADHLDCTQVYVSTLVRGDYKDIPLETTRRCAEYFGCAIEDLFPRPQTAVTA
jgi:plasmid maintenance system antidote protein VapI